MAERQEQAAPDALLTRIGQVVMLHHGGDREEARRRLLELWAETAEAGDPLHRCTLAHYLADTQDDPDAELAWDLRALSAAQELTGADPAPVGGFYPSLHLNLAADYLKLGRSDAARTHLRRARHAADSLADDGYGTGVRAAISRLELRLGPSGGGDGEGFGPPRQRPVG
ncbi:MULTISPECIES: tetratricopeptide repeat protein [unclassified Streptomyces]|uniref:tetratricopeptide repeat protein n=1 Tax=unclassified Streptomyces TaxID=2593676 RepID=UPI00136C79D2|nr:tetratricopeptide repeat protein [Streptomyces sp. SID4985]